MITSITAVLKFNFSLAQCAQQIAELSYIVSKSLSHDKTFPIDVTFLVCV